MLRGYWHRLREIVFELTLKPAAVRFEFAQILRMRFVAHERPPELVTVEKGRAKDWSAG
jgi:hypothetical protein